MKFIPQKAAGKFDKKLLKNSDWYAEERLSGIRTMTVIHGPHVMFSNRIIPRVVTEEFLKQKTPASELTNSKLVVVKPNFDQGQLVGTVLDGVLLLDPMVAGTKLVLFDCLRFAGELISQAPLVRRRRYLRKVIEMWEHPWVEIVPNTTLTGETMGQMAERASVVLKDLSAPYYKPEAWVEVIRS